MTNAAEQGGLSTGERAALDAGFPGDTIAGVCMIVGPIVMVITALLGIGIYHAAGIDYVRGMAAHPTRAAVVFDCFVAGWMFYTVALIGLAGQITAARPWLGRAAGIVTIVGLFGPVFFNGVYFGGFQLTDPSQQAAAGYLIDHAQIIPSNVINLSGPALVIGFIALAIGAAQAGVLGRWRAAALGLGCIMSAGFISGYIVISAVAFLGTAIALVPLGVSLLRPHPTAEGRFASANRHVPQA
ncbi:MAG TPA: hypothetical protein VFI42_07240 [Thermomicrobiaceae bacterium]|nr:hypothetical protein [Thermomicrobiaceae bacterium]